MPIVEFCHLVALVESKRAIDPQDRARWYTEWARLLEVICGLLYFGDQPTTSSYVRFFVKNLGSMCYWQSAERNGA